MSAHPIVALSEGELFCIKNIALSRADGKTLYKKIDQKRSYEDVNYDGVAAEYAVSKYFGIPMDLHVYLGGDGGVSDLFIGDLRCQVKSTNHKHGNFLLNNLSEFKADVAVLVVKDAPGMMRLAGCISRLKFHQIHEVQDYTYGPRVSVSQERLAHVDSLKPYLNQGECP